MMFDFVCDKVGGGGIWLTYIIV